MIIHKEKKVKQSDTSTVGGKREYAATIEVEPFSNQIKNVFQSNVMNKDIRRRQQQRIGK